MKFSLEIANKWTFLGSLGVFLIAIALFVFAATPNPHHSPDQVYPQGSGSTLDADLVDGYEASELLAAGTGSVVAAVCGTLGTLTCTDVPPIFGASAPSSSISLPGGGLLFIEDEIGKVTYYARTQGTSGTLMASSCGASWDFCTGDAKLVMIQCKTCPTGWSGEPIPTGGLIVAGPEATGYDVDSSTGALSSFGEDGGTDPLIASCIDGWYLCYRT